MSEYAFITLNMSEYAGINLKKVLNMAELF